MKFDMKKEDSKFSILIDDMDSFEFDRMRCVLYALLTFSGEEKNVEQVSLHNVMNMVMKEQRNEI